MQLDETGAALSGALRARVKELRDAHLTAQQIRASAEAEGMTLYMTLPALVFGLIFLVAAMLEDLPWLSTDNTAAGRTTLGCSARRPRPSGWRELGTEAGR